MQNSTSQGIRFTGERLIPKINQGAAFYYEHLVRYFFATQFTKGKTTLDVACGVGYGSHICSTLGEAKKIVGVDNSDESLAYAQAHYKTKNINYILDDAEELRHAARNTYDIVISFETIEHLSNPEKFVLRTKAVMKKKGIFLVSTPNKLVYPSGNKFHKNEFTYNQFRDLLKKNFKNVKILVQKYYFSNSLIEQTENKIRTTDSSLFATKVNTLFSDLDLSQCEYFMAICSDSKLPSFDSVNINSSTIDNLNMKNGMVSLAKQVNQLTEFAKIKPEEIMYLKEQERILNQIESSKFFKLWQGYCNVRDKIFKK